MEKKEDNEERSVPMMERLNAGAMISVGSFTSGLLPFLYIRIVQAKGQREDYEKNFLYLNARQSFMMQFVLGGLIGMMVLLACVIFEYTNGGIPQVTTHAGVKYPYAFGVWKTAVGLMTLVGLGYAFAGRVFEYPFVEWFLKKTNLMKFVDGKHREEEKEDEK